jgi:hypothetical protein
MEGRSDALSIALTVRYAMSMRGGVPGVAYAVLDVSGRPMSHITPTRRKHDV